jgi:hypothetical protein
MTFPLTNTHRYTTIARNYVHEFGHYEKQSSFWFQAKACLTQIEDNIVFNGTALRVLN